MEFDINQVYTCIDADKLKVGSKVVCADDLGTLKEIIKKTKLEDDNNRVKELEEVKDENCEFRFVTCYGVYNLAYLISEPEEKKLKWTDLKIGDIIKNEEGTHTYMVIGIDNREKINGGKSNSHILINDTWLDDDDLEYWEKVE